MGEFSLFNYTIHASLSFKIYYHYLSDPVVTEQKAKGQHFLMDDAFGISDC